MLLKEVKPCVQLGLIALMSLSLFFDDGVWIVLGYNVILLFDWVRVTSLLHWSHVFSQQTTACCCSDLDSSCLCDDGTRLGCHGIADRISRGRPMPLKK